MRNGRRRPGTTSRTARVYLTVDVHTYDLLHIAIYPTNTSASAQAFLCALRAKGYHPRVVVTDLRQDFRQLCSRILIWGGRVGENGPALARVFPQAQHHECLFHAMQALHAQLADIHGWDALRHDQQVITLRLCPGCPLDRPYAMYRPAALRRTAGPTYHLDSDQA